MKKKVDELHIQPNKEYSLQEIANQKFIPWAKNYRTLIRMMRDGALGWDIKDTRIVKAKYSKCFIKGSALKKYIINYGPVLITTVPKSK